MAGRTAFVIICIFMLIIADMGGINTAIAESPTSAGYRKAAAQGNAGAQNALGAMYAEGQGVPQDFNEAGKWFRLAAAQGDANAQFNLGRMYQDAKGQWRLR